MTSRDYMVTRSSTCILHSDALQHVQLHTFFPLRISILSHIVIKYDENVELLNVVTE